MISAFQAWQAKTLIALLAAGRLEHDELRALLSGELAGVDVKHNAERDPAEVDTSTPLPATPYERLAATGMIARDFRDAGKGREWDRCRRYDPKIYGYPTDKSRGQSLGVRDWLLIDTIVLHTADAVLHEDRFLGVPSHSATADSGGIVLQHHGNAYLAAAHKLNSYSISIEVSGKAGAIEDRQVEPTRAQIRYWTELLREKHAAAGRVLPIKIVPHRFGHRSRVRDCGPAIWRLACEWGIDELGLVLGDVVGSGSPMDPSWWTPGRAIR